MSASAPSSGGPSMQQPSGAKFFERRLRRAQAIPPEQRSCDVAAFVESAQLVREACRLLPLAPDGQSPALPAGDPAAHRQVLLAFLKLSKASYVALPLPPLGGCGEGTHTAAYLLSGRVAAAAASEPGPLAAVLQLLWRSVLATVEQDSQRAASCAAQAAAMLQDPGRQPAVRRQLGQLGEGAPPLLTLEQLLCVCCTAAAYSNIDMWHKQAAEFAVQMAECTPSLPGLQAAQHEQRMAPLRAAADELERRRAAAAASIAAAAALEPGSLRSTNMHLFAASLQDDMLCKVRHALQLCQAARQRGSDFWCALGAAHAHRTIKVCWHLDDADTASPEHLRLSSAAAEAYRLVLPALQRCRRLLPVPWLAMIEQDVAAIEQGSDLRAAEGSAMNLGALGSGARALLAGEAERRSMHGRCHGCGRQALGLRRCSRCRSAGYCSRECQVNHWRVHKRECKRLEGGAPSSG